ncbi:MAG: hypothetical protein V4671_27250 [Armatimonadota bacterium]
MSKNSEHYTSRLLLFLGILFSGFVISNRWYFLLKLDYPALATSVEDDVFYYFQPAWNFREYHYFTFDGIHAMYGFQPLWMLPLVGLSFICPDKEIFLRASLMLASFCFLGAGYYLYRLLRRYGNPYEAAFATLLFWLANPGVHEIVTRGKENALQCLLLMAAVYHGSHTLRIGLSKKADQRLWLRQIGLGLLFGLLILCRTNALIVLLFYGALALVLGRRQLGGAVSGLARTGLACAAVILPWAIYAQMQFGTVLPTSGVAKLNNLHAMALLPLLRPHELLLLVRGSLNGFAMVMPFVLLLGVLSLVLLRRQKVHKIQGGRGISALLRRHAGVVLLLLYGVSNAIITYTVLHPWYEYGQWYRAPEQCANAALFGIMMVCLLRRMRIRQSLPQIYRWQLVGLTLIYIGTLAFVTGWKNIAYVRSTADRKGYLVDVYKASEWIKANIAPGSRIGSWNCGLLGYLLDGYHVVNLDGLANDLAYLRVSTSGNPASLLNYLSEEKISYLCDADRTDHPDQKYFKLYPMDTAQLLYQGQSPVYFDRYDRRLILIKIDHGPVPVPSGP